MPVLFRCPFARARRARAEALDAERRLDVACGALAGIGETRLRAALLLEISADFQRRDDALAVLTGTPPESDAADSAEALMAAWLAATEILSAEGAAGMAAAVGGRRLPEPWPAARPLLDRLCGTTDLAQRAAVVDALYDVLVDELGLSVVEVLAWVGRAYRALAVAAQRAAVG